MAFQREIILRLGEIYDKTVSSRASISSIIDKYRSDENLRITFDFNHIVFLSRSSAQQIVLEKKLFEQKKTKFNLINIDPQVNKMLELAENKLTRQKIDVEHKQFSSKEELEKFLCDF